MDKLGVYANLRPFLFRLHPERAHHLTLRGLRLAGGSRIASAMLRRVLAASRPAEPVEAYGLKFPNALGVAAGYDKDAVAWRGLGALGLGHVEVGTVTPKPQAGNPKPRVFRLTDDRALINRMGFPNAGAEAVAARLNASRPTGLVVGVNIGKNKDTPLERAADDYVSLIARFAPLADYLAINISSPNTEGLRRLQNRAEMEQLLGACAAERDAQAGRLAKRVPMLVKLAPDLADDALDDALEAIARAGLDGVILTNTTTSREGLRSPEALAREAGGLSGAPLRRRSTDAIRHAHRALGGRLPIVGVGGVDSPRAAKEKLDAGATLVQIYTGLIYEGPGLARRILEELSA